MGETLKIEKMTRDEVSSAYVLYLSEWADPEGHQMNFFDETIDDPDGYFFVAYWSGEMAGWCAMHHGRDSDTPYCKICNMIVKKDFRRKGIGRALMLKMLDIADKLGPDRTLLEVDTENVALKLYESLGFRIVKTVERFYDYGGDAHKMCRYRIPAE